MKHHKIFCPSIARQPTCADNPFVSHGGDDWEAHRDNGPVYLFTNENISGYMNHMSNINGGRVLTVGSSGDHAFEAYLRGAMRVDMFDINSLQKSVIELKTHMIRNLDYDDFLEYFFSGKNGFDSDILRPVKSLFSPELRSYMDMFTRYGSTMLRYDGACSPEIKWQNISYVSNERAYYALRKKLPEAINFVKCDIGALTAHFDQKYNLIMLSNIADYVQDMKIPGEGGRLMDLYTRILSPIAEKNLVDTNGCICFQYFWSAQPAFWHCVIDNVTRQSIHDGIFEPSHRFDSCIFDAAQRSAWVDMVLMLRKNHVK